MRASLILLAACHLSARGIPDGAGDPAEAGADTSVDVPSCYGTSIFRACVMPTGTLTLNGNLDTDTDSLCAITGQATGPDVCLIAAAEVTVNSVTATGTRPVVIIAKDMITVGTLLDVSSRRGGTPGAGADSLVCPVVDGSNSGNVGGGGAGGSFGGAGGNGGNGQNGAPAGAAAPAIALDSVRTGCHGGSGGRGQVAGPPGGASGGAVYLIAGTSITIGGRIAAGGAGGGGGGIQAGGAGGGSGGLVGLDAPVITLANASTSVVANGGGGGEGGGGGAGGSPGQDATNTNQAQGGAGGASAGGDGGDGSSVLAVTGGNAMTGGGTNGAGGGGGGGAGIIWVTSTPTGGTFSPPPQEH